MYRARVAAQIHTGSSTFLLSAALIGHGAQTCAQESKVTEALEFNQWVEVRHAGVTLEEMMQAAFAPWFTVPSTDEWRLKAVKDGPEGLRDYRYWQFRMGIPIANGEINVHVDAEGRVVRMNGAVAKASTIIDPQFTWEQCASKAMSEFNARSVPRVYGRTYEPKRIKDGTAGLMYVQEDVEIPLQRATLALCYRMVLVSNGTPLVAGDAQFVLVDARTGRILRTASTARGNCTEADVLTLFNGWRTVNTRWRAFPNFDYVTEDLCRGDGIYSWVSTSQSGWRPIDDNGTSWSLYEERPVTSALWAGAMTYDYWWNVHGRNSWDANGGMVRIHARDNELGSDGAFWDDDIEVIRCGTGGGDQTQYAFVGLEHIGHEFAHGISGMECGWSTSSSMETQSLDEGVSDAFGVMVDFEAAGSNANYLLGENNGLPGGAARNMADPGSKNMPDTYLGAHWSYSSDVQLAKYINMGVVNYWYFLLVEGGAGVNDNSDAYVVDGIGRHDAARILYRAMYAYLGPTSQFADAKNATIYSAIDLFGACSDQVIQTINAWNAVGVESALGMGADVDVDCGPVLAAHNAGTAVTRRAIDGLLTNCNILANGALVDLYAGESVIMLPGFNSGDRFLAMIDPCTSEARSLSVPDGGAGRIAYSEEKRSSNENDEFPSMEFAFKVWPNPSPGKVVVRLKGGLYEKYGAWTLEIVSTIGVSIATYQVAADAIAVDLVVPNGVYFLRIRQREQNAVERLVIEAW